MSTTEDQPPPELISPDLKQAIKKLSNKYELQDYVCHLTSYHAQHLTDEFLLLKERLLLQGLDDDDLHLLHDFLQVKFDGELMKMADKNLTKKQAVKLDQYLTN